MITLLLIGTLIYLIPSIVVTWKLYKKAGFKGWESIVPFYSMYIFGLISKKAMWIVWTAVVLSVASVVPQLDFLGLPSFIFALILLAGFIKQYSAGLGFWVAYIILPFVSLFMVDKIDFIGEPVKGAPNPPAKTTKAAAKKKSQPKK